jgi:hypothetical protein
MYPRVPLSESKYPFASFCNRIEAASIVLYRLLVLSDVALPLQLGCRTSLQLRSRGRLSSRRVLSSSSPASLPDRHSSLSLWPSVCIRGEHPIKGSYLPTTWLHVCPCLEFTDSGTTRRAALQERRGVEEKGGRSSLVRVFLAV